MPSTEGSTDRRAGETLLEGLGAVLMDCAGMLAGQFPAISQLWMVAARALSERFSCSAWTPTEAEGLLLDAASDRLTPSFSIVDGLIALIVEQVATDARPEHVVAVDRSLDGLRRLAGLLHQAMPAAFDHQAMRAAMDR